MSRWRPLEDYTPFARTLVHYMWDQRPPLLPAQFADKAGVSRQLISRILNQDVQPDPLAVRAMARSMQMPTSHLFTLAGYTTASDPLYAQEEVWEVVFATIAAASGLPAEEQTALLTRLVQIRDGVFTAASDNGVEEAVVAQEEPQEAIVRVDEAVSA